MEHCSAAQSSNIDKICHLFIQCSHQEQLQLLEKLPTLIYRDFICCLPSLALCLVLKYLTISDVLICMKVCRKWYTTIQSCDPYWRWVCLSSGLTPPVIKDYLAQQCYSSKMHLGLTLQAYIHKMKQIFAHCTAYTHRTSDTVLKMAFEDNYGNNLACIQKSNEILFIYYNSANDQALKSFGLSEQYRIIWATRTKRYILFTTDSADWGQIHCCDGQTQLWVDSEIVTPYAKLSACSLCGLIVEAQQQPSIKSPLTWMMQFVLLEPTSIAVQRVTHYAQVKDLIALESDYVPIQSIALLKKPDSHTNNSMGFCLEHYLLIKLGGGVIMFTYQQSRNSRSENDLSSDIQFISIFAPGGEVNHLNSLISLGDKFRLSCDGILLALIHSNILYVWNIQQNLLVSEINLSIHNSFNQESSRYSLLAVGHLCAIIQLTHYNTSKLLILSIFNGVLLCSLNCNSVQAFAGPVSQDWLNNLDVSFDCIVFPFQKEPLLGITCGDK